VIGNTVSADLIDYLKRDTYRLGMERTLDLHVLNYYTLVPAEEPTDHDGHHEKDTTVLTQQAPKRFRCAIQIHDSKRGTSRAGLINDIFRLLDIRQEIHEKAVMHRVVQSGIAMFSRALLLLGNQKPTSEDLVCLGAKHHALQGEDLFLDALLKLKTPHGRAGHRIREGVRIVEKLVDRRVYRPLVIIPGDRAATHFKFSSRDIDARRGREFNLQTLGAIVDSTFYSAFLLFVSSCIEDLLVGVIPSEQELIGRIKGLDNSPAALDSAMNLVPSRVIIWTTPYKQLYKDPGVVVALSDVVERIDELCCDAAKQSSSDLAVLGLVASAIGHADSKYAAMWKLYVFVSDGLYYTGLLSKLKGSAGRTNSPKESHLAQLRRAEALVVAAIEAIAEDWQNYCDRTESADDRASRLGRGMDSEKFRNLLHLWLAKYGMNESRDTDPTVGLSEVNVQQYVHEWNASGCPVGDRCRDVRYKYPLSAQANWIAAKEEEVGSSARAVVEYLERCGFSSPDILSSAEFEQLVEQWEAAEDGAKLQRGQGNDHLSIERLWTSMLPKVNETSRPEVAGSEETVPRLEWTDQPAIPEVPSKRIAATAELPSSRAEVRKWLKEEAKSLSPHVRGQLTRDLEPLLDFLFREIVDDRVRREAIADLRRRIINESSLIFNNLKTDQVLVALKRRFQSSTLLP
jgi:hypothetical protein